mgnify:CR=1 FL=1
MDDITRMVCTLDPNIPACVASIKESVINLVTEDEIVRDFLMHP